MSTPITSRPRRTSASRRATAASAARAADAASLARRARRSDRYLQCAYRRPSRRAKPSSSRACARFATARRRSWPRRSRPSPRRRRSTAASMTHSTSARPRPATTSSSSRRRSRSGWRSRAASRRSSASRRPWRSSISPRSSRTSCSPIRGHLEGAEKEAADLWRWHAVEEIEHKGVAYDTWLHATRDWPRWKRWKVKAKVMLYVTRNFVVDRTAGALELMRQDGVTGLRAWAKLLWYLWVRPGMFRKIAGAWVEVFPAGLPSVERGRPALARCLCGDRRGRRAQAKGEAGRVDPPVGEADGAGPLSAAEWWRGRPPHLRLPPPHPRFRAGRS